MGEACAPQRIVIILYIYSCPILNSVYYLSPILDSSVDSMVNTLFYFSRSSSVAGSGGDEGRSPKATTETVLEIATLTPGLYHVRLHAHTGATHTILLVKQ